MTGVRGERGSSSMAGGMTGVRGERGSSSMTGGMASSLGGGGGSSSMAGGMSSSSGGGGTSSMAGGMTSSRGGRGSSAMTGGMSSSGGGGSGSMAGGMSSSSGGAGSSSMAGGMASSRSGGGSSSMAGGMSNSMGGGGSSSMAGGMSNSMGGGGSSSMTGGMSNSMGGGGSSSMAGGIAMGGGSSSMSGAMSGAMGGGSSSMSGAMSGAMGGGSMAGGGSFARGGGLSSAMAGGMSSSQSGGGSNALWFPLEAVLTSVLHIREASSLQSSYSYVLEDRRARRAAWRKLVEERRRYRRERRNRNSRAKLYGGEPRPLPVWVAFLPSTASPCPEAVENLKTTEVPREPEVKTTPTPATIPLETTRFGLLALFRKKPTLGPSEDQAPEPITGRLEFLRPNKDVTHAPKTESERPLPSEDASAVEASSSASNQTENVSPDAISGGSPPVQSASKRRSSTGGADNSPWSQGVKSKDSKKGRKKQRAAPTVDQTEPVRDEAAAGEDGSRGDAPDPGSEKTFMDVTTEVDKGRGDREDTKVKVATRGKRKTRSATKPKDE
ncbi:uncharacterized protein LOC108864990 [Galendromus occidentalis]|uniref:Uncharacterized protein LOC108864990 n=1 Tax=Galendromus occidentalis TaxID=34638 RepID=A0AAJ7WK23_9ACAR|nr:uncharacterized protein LOC108864990 [Galendromus occidentalis]